MAAQDSVGRLRYYLAAAAFGCWVRRCGAAAMSLVLLLVIPSPAEWPPGWPRAGARPPAAGSPSPRRWRVWGWPYRVGPGITAGGAAEVLAKVPHSHVLGGAPFDLDFDHSWIPQAGIRFHLAAMV